MQPGVAALFAAAGRDPRQASAADFGFALGPRLNAAGRLADMTLGIECLLTDDAGARRRARRRRSTRSTASGARSRRGCASRPSRWSTAPLAAAGEVDAAFAVFDPDFHEGVVGIIASRLKDRLHRPDLRLRARPGRRAQGLGPLDRGLSPARRARPGEQAPSRRCSSASAAMRWRPAARSRRVDFELFRGALQEVAREGLSTAPLGAARRQRRAARRRRTRRWRPPA